MLLAQITNISSGTVTVQLSNGAVIQLPPNGILENVDVINLAGIQNSLQIRYPLND